MKRFADVDIEQLLNDKSSKKTKYNEDYAYRLLKLFADRQNIDIISIDKTSLCDLLEKFYPSIRKEDGNEFCANSLTSIRFSLQRKLMNLRSIDIIKSPLYLKCNKAFDAVLIDLK